MNDAIAIATQIIETGHVAKAQLGITVVNVDKMVSDMVAEYYSIPDGAWIYSVNKNSAAEKAGLKSGDIIVKIDGKEISETEELTSQLKEYSAGDTVVLSIFRSNQSEYLEIEVVLEEQGASVASSDSFQIPADMNTR